MSVKQKLITALTACGFVEGETLFLQGTLGDNPYPQSFVTFWTEATYDRSHYNNEVKSAEWNISVIYYSNSAANVNSVPDTIRTALKAEGFIPQGRGQDIASDEPSCTGWQMDYKYIEQL